METTLSIPREGGRRPISTLSKVAIGALVAFAGVMSYGMVRLFGEFIPPFAIMALVGVVIAGLITIGWRWTPALGSVLLLLPVLMLGEMFKGVLTQYSVAGLTMFTWVAVLLAVLVVGIVAGVSATMQNYMRPAENRRTPRLLVPTLAAVAALVVGASLVVAAPQPGTVMDISPAAMAELPALGAENFEFTSTELRVKAGETVTMRLDNLKDFEGHFFDVDELNVHAPMPPGQSSVVIFTPTTPGTYTFYCHPHADKASGEGMVGTLIVE